MKRLIALLALTLTACQTDRRPPALAAGPTLIQGFDANNNPTLTSYAGRTSAASGQVSNTTSADTIRLLAERIDGKAFTYARATRSAVQQPDVDIEAKLEQEGKDALLEAGKALAAGAQGDYAKALEKAGAVGDKLAAFKAAKPNAPKPDQNAIDTEVLSSGEGHGLVAAALGREFGQTLRDSKRATYESDTATKIKDTSSDESIEAILKTIAEAKRPILPPVAQPPIEIPVPFPSPVSTNAPPAIVTGTNVVETIQLPVIE